MLEAGRECLSAQYAKGGCAGCTVADCCVLGAQVTTLSVPVPADGGWTVPVYQFLLLVVGGLEEPDVNLAGREIEELTKALFKPHLILLQQRTSL